MHGSDVRQRPGSAGHRGQAARGCVAGCRKANADRRRRRAQVLLSQTDDLWFEILPSLQVLEALNLRQLSYTPAHAIRGEMAHLEAFTERVEDHIADFLADVAVSPAADLLGPTRQVRSISAT